MHSQLPRFLVLSWSDFQKKVVTRIENILRIVLGVPDVSYAHLFVTLERVRVWYLELGLTLVIMLGLGVCVRVTG